MQSHWDIARGPQTLVGGSSLGRVWPLPPFESEAQRQRRLKMLGALLSDHLPLSLRQVLPGSLPPWILKQNSGETFMLHLCKGIPAPFPDMP